MIRPDFALCPERLAAWTALMLGAVWLGAGCAGKSGTESKRSPAVGGEHGSTPLGGGGGGGGEGDDGGEGGEGAGEASAGNQGGVEPCLSTTCAAQGAECGTIPDDCGGMLDCGECANGCACNEQGQCEHDALSPDPFEQRSSRSAASSGFPGTEQQYRELYDVPCTTQEDCIDSCAERGGTSDMCEASTCVDSTEDYCLPATIWTELDALATEGTMLADCAELVLWSDPYRDVLRVTDFGFDIPSSAEISGITLEVRRAAGSADEAVDDGIHLLKGGALSSADRSRPEPWTGPELSDVEYGGPSDLWGESFTPADVNSPDFGAALAVGFTQDIGSGRAYVDIVRATVHYRLQCE
jgi:hypothetical protein